MQGAYGKRAPEKCGYAGDAKGKDAGLEKVSVHHRHSLAETAMYRFKQLLAGEISLRNYNSQVGGVMAYISAINKLNTLTLPVRQPRV